MTRFLNTAPGSRNTSESADGGEILRRTLEHVLELGERGVEIVELDQRASQRNARREISGMEFETGAADLHRLVVAAGAPQFFRQLREGDRRRVLLNPAPKILNPLAVSHSFRYEATVMFFVVATPVNTELFWKPSKVSATIFPSAWKN